MFSKEFLKVPVWRIIAGMVFFFITGNLIHEMGHIFTGLMFGCTIYNAVFFGTGAITYMSVSSNPMIEILISASGTLTLPIYLALHRGVFGKFIPYERNFIIVVWVFSFLMGADLQRILSILPTVHF